MIGGRDANPAAANAPNTNTTANTSKTDVRTKDLLTTLTSSPMNTSSIGRTAPAPAITVAIAEKNDKLLQTQNTLVLMCCFTEAYVSYVPGAAGSGTGNS